jgi:pimeloyl-ACP methyl ester carboxylesterase
MIRMMISALALAASPPNPAQIAPSGHWEGVLVEHGQAMPIQFDFESQGAGLSGRFTAPRWAVMDYPLGDVRAGEGRIHWRMGDADVFDGTVSGEAIRGSFTGDVGQGDFQLHRSAPPNAPYTLLPVSFSNGGVQLSGTLCLPVTPGRHPAAILVQGSGPEIRWGTNRYLADRLARAGIAALIYDKRGSGDSGGDWKTASFEDLADDALAGVASLTARPEIDPRRIGIIGHSQGGIIASLAAARAPGRLSFIVAEDTVAGPVRDQDLYRVKNGLAELHLSPADQAKAMEIFSLFVDAARGARPYSDLASASAPYLATDWYKWLDIPPRESWVWAWYRKTGNYDTLLAWRAVRAPTLLIYGEKDALVPVDQSIAEIEQALDANASEYTAVIVPAAEHNLTIHPGSGEPFFWWRKAPGIMDLVVMWSRQQTIQPRAR